MTFNIYHDITNPEFTINQPADVVFEINQLVLPVLPDNIVESVTSTDNHIVVNNDDPKNPSLSFQLVDNENLLTDDQLALVESSLQPDDLPTFGDIVTHDADEFAVSSHNHSLANLTERSYNSLTDKPNLSLLEDIIDVQWWGESTPEGLAVEGDLFYFTTDSLLYTYVDGNWLNTPFQWKIYLNKDTTSDFFGKYFVYNGTELSIIPDGLVLGETSSTAFDGLRGKAAYDHSQITSGNPHGTTAANVGAEPANENIQSHISDNDIHVMTTDKSNWNGKQDALTFSTDIEADKASEMKVSAIKYIYDFFGKLSTANIWSLRQLFSSGFDADGMINHKAGEYFYHAVSKTADTVNDRREYTASGVKYFQRCTAVLSGVLNVKGSGTWTTDISISAAGVLNVGEIGNVKYTFNPNTGGLFNNVFAFRWSNSYDNYFTKDVGLTRNSAGILEINDGITAGTFRDLKLRSLFADIFKANLATGFTFKNSSDVDVFAINNNGFLLDQYDDIMPAMGWVDAAGGTAPDVTAHTIGGIAVNYKSFDGGTTTEAMTNAFEITHAIDVDALNRVTAPLLAEMHTHGMAATTGAGVVKIFYDLVYHPVNAAPITWGTFSNLITINANEQYWHKLGGVELTKPSSGFAIGDKITCKYYRVPTDAQDTYTGDWLFMQCAMHMPLNSNGSRQRYVK